MIVAMSIFQYWTDPDSFHIVRNIGIIAVIFPIGGIFFGLWTWAVAERNYEAFIAKNKETEQGVTPQFATRSEFDFPA